MAVPSASTIFTSAAALITAAVVLLFASSVLAGRLPDAAAPAPRGDSVTVENNDEILLAKKKKPKKKHKSKKERSEETPEVEEGAATEETDGGEGAPEDAEDVEVVPDDEGTNAAADNAGEPSGPTLQRGNRMEFDGRLIRGETAGAGAVFLFERAPRPLPSMVKRRRSYLGDTVDGVLGVGWNEWEADDKATAEPEPEDVDSQTKKKKRRSK